MSNFYPSKNTEFNHHIVIDYQRVTLNKNEVSVPNDGRGGFMISYPNTSSENNFFYTNQGTQYNYMHTKMHVYKPIHFNIEGVTTNNDNIVGELIIEHTTSSDQNKLYTCYLLETKSLQITDENEIDRMLAINDRQEPTIEVELNSIIPKQESCIVYNDNDNKICVFTTPIQINTASKDNIANNFGNVTTMFNNYPGQGESYIVIPSNNISNRDAEEIYIDCSPTGASEEEQNTYNIPINSKMASESQESDMMKTTVNYGLFVLAMLVSYITVPLLYKNLIIDGSAIAFTTDEKLRFTRIRAADILIGLVMFITISSLVSTGGATDDYQLISVGIFLFVFSILSYGLIQLKKTDLTFMTTKVEGAVVESDQSSSIAETIEAFPFDDLWPTISVVIGLFFSSDSLSAYFAVIIMGIITLSILYLLGSLPLVAYGNLTGIFAGIFVVISIVIALKKKFNAQVKVAP
ncbi:hypothetical protein OAS95_02110 [Pelagibacteraceae bacterium]|nr:hypothetical protein [Pelagibacteraceae bacterium]